MYLTHLCEDMILMSVSADHELKANVDFSVAL